MTIALYMTIAFQTASAELGGGVGAVASDSHLDLSRHAPYVLYGC